MKLFSFLIGALVGATLLAAVAYMLLRRSVRVVRSTVATARRQNEAGRLEVDLCVPKKGGAEFPTDEIQQELNLLLGEGYDCDEVSQGPRKCVFYIFGPNVEHIVETCRRLNIEEKLPRGSWLRVYVGVEGAESRIEKL